MKRLLIRLLSMILIGMATSHEIVVKAQKPQEILKIVDSTISVNHSIQYDYTYQGWGKAAGQFEGSVIINKERGLQLLVTLKTMDESGKTVKEEIIYTDGDSLKLLDKTANVLKIGTANGGSGYLMSYAWYAVFRESLMPNPFARSISSEGIKYEGTIKISEVDCHIISMDNPWGDRNYWYFGIDDFQIHGLKQENKNQGTEGGFIFHMSELILNEDIDPKVFKILPKGSTVINEDERIIAVGKQSPEWQMENAANEIVSSRMLKGKTVILDFWASWCAPCWQIMPIIDQIKSDYENSDVAVYGVNVWENPKLDINDYLDKKQLNHYSVLFDRDASVAKSFKIAYLPLLVVIGSDGKILYHNNGMDPHMDENIRKILNEK